LYSVCAGSISSQGKVAGAWNWPLMPNTGVEHEYGHTSTLLHVVVSCALTASLLWSVAPCCLTGHQHFEGTNCFHRQEKLNIEFHWNFGICAKDFKVLLVSVNALYVAVNNKCCCQILQHSVCLVINRYNFINEERACDVAASYQTRSKFAWFQASAAKEMRIALFCVITQRVVVISYRESPIFRVRNWRCDR